MITGSAAPALLSFLLFSYFRVCAFSIKRTRLSRKPGTGYHIVDRPHQLATEANMLNKHNIKVSYMIGVKLAEHLQEVLKN